VIAPEGRVCETSRVIAIKTLFSRTFLTGLALGLLTAGLASYKMKKKNNLHNLGLTPEAVRKAARRKIPG
jgi:type III secretory pathway component EscU